MKIYYDRRTGEFVKNPDAIAPPELFVPYEIGALEGVVIERYGFSDGSRLDYSYTILEMENTTREMQYIKRNEFFNEHLGNNSLAPRLLSMVIPRDIFMTYCEECGFNDYVRALKKEEKRGEK